MKERKAMVTGGGTVGVRELKNRLTHYLKVVGKGTRLVVTDRGRPVAVMSAAKAQAGKETLEERLASLAGRGDIALPPRRGALGRRKAVKAKGTPASRLAVEERR